MMMLGKRGSAVLDAPVEGYALESGWDIPEPAPPGTLHVTHENGPDSLPPLETESWPQQSVTPRYRLRVGIPGTIAGRVALATGLVFALGVVGAALLAARYSMLHDARFVLVSPSNIEIEGIHRLTRPRVASVFAADLERNVFQAPLAERQTDLERLPWVQHASVMRLLPDHIRVQITERTPVAFVRQGTQIGLVDAGGVLLDMPEDAAGDPEYSFPVLTGILSTDPLTVRTARMDIYRRFMQDLDSSGQGYTKTVSEVDVSNPEDVKALIGSDGKDILVHFGEEKFLERYQLFEQHLPEWKVQYPKLNAVDTRYEHQLVLEMAQNDVPSAVIPAAHPAPAKSIAKVPVAKHPTVKPVVHPANSTPHKAILSHGPVHP